MSMFEEIKKTFSVFKNSCGYTAKSSKETAWSGSSFPFEAKIHPENPNFVQITMNISVYRPTENSMTAKDVADEYADRLYSAGFLITKIENEKEREELQDMEYMGWSEADIIVDIPLESASVENLKQAHRNILGEQYSNALWEVYSAKKQCISREHGEKYAEEISRSAVSGLIDKAGYVLALDCR